MVVVSQVILWIMMILMVVSGIDRFTGYHLGLGDKFEEGFNALGALALSMVGAICIAPVLGAVLEPIIGPIYEALGASPAMFATTLLANDMGGQPLAMALSGADSVIAAGGLEAITDPALRAVAQTKLNAGNFAGLILGAMMGPTIVFSIPVALGIIRLEDRPFLARGILIGMVTIPLGCLAGGFVAGYPFIWMIKNLVPVIMVAIMIVVGLLAIPNIMINAFLWFGKFVIALLTVALIAAGIEALLEIRLIYWTTIVIDPLTNMPMIDPKTNEVVKNVINMAPISEGFGVIGSIAVVLAGAFTLVHLMTKFLGRPLEKVGGLIGMNTQAAAGLVATMANNIAMFSILKDMDDRGKVINVAFAVSAAFVFGDHLGFTAGVNQSMIAAVVAGKLVGGVTAVLLALIMVPKNFSGAKASEKA